MFISEWNDLLAVILSPTRLFFLHTDLPLPIQSLQFLYLLQQFLNPPV